MNDEDIWLNDVIHSLRTDVHSNPNIVPSPFSLKNEHISNQSNSEYEDKMCLLKYEWLDPEKEPPDNPKIHLVNEMTQEATDRQNDERQKLQYIIHTLEEKRKRKLTAKEVKARSRKLTNAECIGKYMEGKHWTRREDGTWNVPDDKLDDELNNDEKDDKVSDNSIHHLSKIDMQDQLQTDMGANINATNDRSILHNYREIVPKTVQGINDGESNQYKARLTGVGEYSLKSTEGETINIMMYYGETLTGTVISPTAIAKQFGLCKHGNKVRRTAT